MFGTLRTSAPYRLVCVMTAYLSARTKSRCPPCTARRTAKAIMPWESGSDEANRKKRYEGTRPGIRETEAGKPPGDDAWPSLLRKHCDMGRGEGLSDQPEACKPFVSRVIHKTVCELRRFKKCMEADCATEAKCLAKNFKPDCRKIRKTYPLMEAVQKASIAGYPLPPPAKKKPAEPVICKEKTEDSAAKAAIECPEKDTRMVADPKTGCLIAKSELEARTTLTCPYEAPPKVKKNRRFLRKIKCPEQENVIPIGTVAVSAKKCAKNVKKKVTSTSNENSQ